MTVFEPVRSLLDRAAGIVARFGLASGPSGQREKAAAAGLLVLVVLGLTLPPVSLFTRLTSLGYTPVPAGSQATVHAQGDGSTLEIDRFDLRRSTRLKLEAVPAADGPRQLADLPGGRDIVSSALRLDFKGARPDKAWLTVPLSVGADEQPFVDPYCWDGRRWVWLSSRFPNASSRLRIEVPLRDVNCRWVAVTRATERATELGVVVLPPPATVPAAVADMPIVEVRAYRLSADDGTVSGALVAPVSQEARVYGVIDNVEAGRVRGDLVTNVLIRPAARQRNRQAIVDLVRRDALRGVVLDYRNVPDDLQPTYLQFLRDLRADLAAEGAELVVVVQAPRRSADGWDPGPVSWRDLGDAADAVRVALPVGQPIDVAALEDLVRWGLRSVERGRLQLAVSVQGRDEVDGEVTATSFGAALGRILDMARSDTPGRVSPGESRTVDLPTLQASGFGWDEASGLWRFRYWDANRREHTVWLNDAAGLSSAFAVASRYRLGRLLLDGVEAGLDPSVWRLATRFLETGATDASREGYKLRWQLTTETGQLVQEAVQPLGASSFALSAPTDPGTYRLSVNLVAADGTLVALGQAAQVAVAPAPAPTAPPTPLLIYLAPTAMPFATAPAPADEAALRRTPMPIAQAPATVTASPYGARLAVAQAELRAAPSLTAEVVSDLRTGDVLEILVRTASGDWLKIRSMSTGIEGWVLAELLEYDTPLSRIAVEEAATPEGL